jgi:hypothetical protein
MPKFMSPLNAVDYFLNKYILPERTLVVTGDRRSGNHACVYWILSSLAGKDVISAYGKQPRSGFRCYPEQGFIFINDLSSCLAETSLRRLLLQNKSLFKKCALVILGFEDVGSEVISRNPLLRRHQFIRVSRNMPDVLASRYESLVRLALDGGSNLNAFSMNHKWFEKSFSWHNRQHFCLDKNVADWSFDNWKVDASYRESFLRSIGLQCADLYPIAISGEGGGSSFSGVTCDCDRLTTVSHQKNFKKFMATCIKNYPGSFSPGDLIRVNSYLDSGTSKNQEFHTYRKIQKKRLAAPKGIKIVQQND